VQEREPQCGLDRRRPQIPLDPVENRLEAGELARRVQVEQLVDETIAAVDNGESIAQTVANLAVVLGFGPGAPEVLLVDRAGPLFGAAALGGIDSASDSRPGRLRQRRSDEPR
jgi:hypothetical protein